MKKKLLVVVAGFGLAVGVNGQKQPTGYASSIKEISGGTSFLAVGNNNVTQNDDIFYPLVTAYSAINGVGYYNYPAFGFMRPTTNINGDAVISNRGDGLSTLYWKFKPDGSFAVPGNINATGQLLSKAPVGIASSNWNIGSGASLQGNSAFITQNDDMFYPIVAASSFINGLGYWNCPAFGYIRPTLATQGNNYNGDVVIQNSGDGLATVRWKFKPDGAFVCPGGIAANGTIHAREVKVDLTGWSDFVFAPAYKLKTLVEVEQYIKTHNHLPEIPSAKEVEQNGVNVGDMQAKLLQKVEELTLYVIELKKENEEMKKKVTALENR